MTIDIKAPTFPESISEGTVAAWHVMPGESIARDELLVDIETDKVVIEVFSPADGCLTEVIKEEGETVESEEVIAQFEAGSIETPTTASVAEPGNSTADEASARLSPAARKLAEENAIDTQELTGTGRDGRITKTDVLTVVNAGDRDVDDATQSSASVSQEFDSGELSGRVERRVPMTRLRASLAQRLVEGQQTAVTLTTFNEVDMEPIKRIREKYQREFEQSHHGTRLGFMSFFVRASVEALKRFPLVNASIDENDIVYHGYYDIGVAVGTERGLVVPVIRDADALGLAQIEDQVTEYGARARDGKLSLEDLQGGTFTISNGGVFGSLMSTPVLNPPQTAILGMHKIQDRPVVEDGEVVVRPMMYLALSYDHRLIDGQEAVRFLVAIKGMIEDPARILLEL
ncbi:MAG: 2-oxoglutarate dehydrogenase complex dihydrolipoyllysine-residue succinyltransferase [Pseudomonadales bacterium]|nr:2-oxoglutarate dehydrogenase complex dihydrolipoyllysine-residue succinyltransferase [Pseudomonadales bacterium]